MQNRANTKIVSMKTTWRAKKKKKKKIRTVLLASCTIRSIDKGQLTYKSSRCRDTDVKENKEVSSTEVWMHSSWGSVTLWNFFFVFANPIVVLQYWRISSIFLAKGTSKEAKQEARKNFFWQSCLTFQNIHAVVKNCIKNYCAGLVCWGLCLVD